MKLRITDQYQNMAEIIAGCMHLIEKCKKACENAGVVPLCSLRSVAAQTDASSALWDFLARTLEQGTCIPWTIWNTSRQREWTRLWISQLSL